MQHHKVNRRRLIESLQRAGWVETGRDSVFSLVFSRPDKDYVLKVGRPGKADEDGWLPFARYCVDHWQSNPHLPRVDFVHVLGSGQRRFLFARIEKLVEFNAGDEATRFRLTAERTSARYRLSGLSEFHLPGSLEEVVEMIRRRFAKVWKPDLHWDNTMVRLGDDGAATLVLTDPLSYPRGWDDDE